MGMRKSGMAVMGWMMGVAVIGSACHASVGAAESAGALGVSASAEHAQDAPKPECKALPIPATGMHCINTNGNWSWGVVRFKEQDCPFLKLEYVTQDRRPVTIIAGVLSSSVSKGSKIGGVEPPKRAETAGVQGFRLMHCAGGDAQDEILELRAGFMFSVVGPKTEGRGPDRAYWPLIVRTRSIPAGAFGTTFVMMGSDRLAQNQIGEIEIVARPNQGSECKDAGEKDGMSKIVVLAQPKAPNEMSIMTETSTVRWIKGAANGAPEPLEQDEKRFLSDVCEFAKLAMAGTTDDKPRLEVLECDVKKEPKSKK
ncbi:MAG: hypothetical protein K2W85_08575 [Phycisphaerales bacterium]|nr:hypothetical protein [Phycisphaerales bacterium]